MKKNRLFIFTTSASLVVAALLLSAANAPGGQAIMAGASSGLSDAPTQTLLKASITRGKQVYLQVCLACHQVDAGGVEGMNPPLIKTKYVLGPKTPLIKIVLNGMTGNVDINGDTYHNVMAPHSDLTDLQIADVLTYVRNSFGNKASAVTVAQVKAVRAANKPAGK